MLIYIFITAIIVFLLAIIYYYSITRQIGATCGFYDMAYILLSLDKNGKEPVPSELHEKVSEMIKDADDSGIGTNVGEIFDIDKLEQLCQKNGLNAKKINSAIFFHNIKKGSSEISRYSYFIVPVQQDSPHFIVVTRNKNGTTATWDSNDFLNTKKYTISELKSSHESMPDKYNWDSYIEKISFAKRPGFVFGRSIRMAMLGVKYGKLVGMIKQKEKKCLKEYETYDSSVNLKGYVIGIRGRTEY